MFQKVQGHVHPLTGRNKIILVLILRFLVIEGNKNMVVVRLKFKSLERIIGSAPEAKFSLRSRQKTGFPEVNNWKNYAFSVELPYTNLEASKLCLYLKPFLIGACIMENYNIKLEPRPSEVNNKK